MKVYRDYHDELAERYYKHHEMDKQTFDQLHAVMAEAHTDNSVLSELAQGKRYADLPKAIKDKIDLLDPSITEGYKNHV